MSRSGRQATVECYEGDVWPENYQFNYVQDGYHAPQARASSSFRDNFRQPSHPWLQLKSIDKGERQDYWNRLAEIQDYSLEPPRTIDWNLLNSAGIQAQFQEWFGTRFMPDDSIEPTWLPMWERIFQLNRVVKKEWCQEFYSTLKVDLLPIENKIDQRVIHFRLGGRQRHCTVGEFGYLCGMFQLDEFENGVVGHFLAGGDWELTSFPDEMTFHDYWFRISGKTPFTTAVSKVSDIRSKRLRLLHKMITYSFLHRGNQNDKVYAEDLWLLRQFSEFGPDYYACAPYILARHMQKYRERRYLCGHFITMMMERLGRAGDHVRHISEEKSMLIIDKTELRKAKLMDDFGELLPDEDEGPPRQRQRVEDEQPHTPPHRPIPVPPSPPHHTSSSFNFSGMEATLHQILWNQDRMMDHQCTMGSQVNRMAYQQEYWAPHINRWVQAEQPNVRPYSPPNIFMPATTTYGFFYPPHDQAGASIGTAGASTSGGGIPQFGTFTQGERYSGPAYDYYDGGFFGEWRDPDAGDGVRSTFMDEDEED